MTDKTIDDPNRLPLFGVTLKVRPRPAHPSYYDWQFGFLIVIVYADNAERAGAITRSIVEQLPYEQVGTAVSVRATEDFKCKAAVEQGRQLGLGLALFAMETGAEESEFEAMDFP